MFCAQKAVEQKQTYLLTDQSNITQFYTTELCEDMVNIEPYNLNTSIIDNMHTCTMLFSYLQCTPCTVHEYTYMCTYTYKPTTLRALNIVKFAKKQKT